MPDKTWKAVERRIAELMGGERGGPINEEDVLHPDFSIEVKHRKALPKWLHDAYGQAEGRAEGRVPIAVLHERYMKYEDSYVVLSIRDLLNLLEGEDDEQDTDAD